MSCVIKENYRSHDKRSMPLDTCLAIWQADMFACSAFFKVKSKKIGSYFDHLDRTASIRESYDRCYLAQVLSWTEVVRFWFCPMALWIRMLLLFWSLCGAKQMQISAESIAELVEAAQTPTTADDRSRWITGWSDQYQMNFYWHQDTGEAYWFPPWQCVACSSYLWFGVWELPIILVNPFREGRGCHECYWRAHHAHGCQRQ